MKLIWALFFLTATVAFVRAGSEEEDLPGNLADNELSAADEFSDEDELEEYDDSSKAAPKKGRFKIRRLWRVKRLMRVSLNIMELQNIKRFYRLSSK